MFLIKKPKFVTFWEILLFELHPTANLLPLAVFKKLKIFLEKPIFFSKVSQVSNVLRYLTNSVAFYSKFATFGIFVRKSQFLFEKHNNLYKYKNINITNWLLLAVFKKTQFFFKKPIFFFQEEATFLTLWEILLIQLHPTTNFLSLAVFKKVNLFQKIHIFYIKKPKFEHFEKFIHSVAMYSKFTTFSTFSLKKVFVRKEPIYFLKPQIFGRFEASYLLNCIVVQVCYL